MRGWGIQFGTTRDDVRANPLYQKALKLAHRRSVVSEDNRINLYLISRFFLPRLAPGHITEVRRPSRVATRSSWPAWLPRSFRRRGCTRSTHTPEFRKPTRPSTRTPPETTRTWTCRSFANSSRAHGITNVEFVEGRFEDSVPAALSPYRQGLAGAHRQRHLHVGRLRLRQRAGRIRSAAATWFSTTRPCRAVLAPPRRSSRWQ